MNTLKFEPKHDAYETPAVRADRLAIWILLAVGLFLMLVATGRADQGSATRTESISGTLSPGQTLSVENVSGDIVASPGKAFGAAVTITVSAPTQKQAEELLRSTRIEQSHDEDGWSLETRWPGMHGRSDRGRDSACSRCRVEAAYTLTIPPGVTVELKTVSGDVRVRDLDGGLSLESVNGAIEARGVRKSLEAQTVNGSIDAGSLSLDAEDSLELQSVNGSVTLTLPKDAQFDLSAETMNGTIASTFPLPKQPLVPGRASGGRTPKPSKGHESKSSQIVVTDDEGDTTVVDLDELDQELAESMKDVEREIREAEREMRESEKDMREMSREIRTIRIADPRRDYSGSIGKGGASVRLQTLNGTVLLLAAGTKEADAKPLVSGRREFVVTVPEVRVRVPKVVVNPRSPVPPGAPPAPPVPPVGQVPPAPPAPPADFDGEVVRGDVTGDFLSTTSGGSYRIGRVSGRVKILTHSGEIRVGGIGSGGELKTFGGDVVLGPVTGDLKVSTAAGDIRIDSVSGSLLADTAGGDIRIQSVGGSLDANTAGGDVIVPRVGGSVRASTAGGDVRIGVTSPDVRGGITIRNSGGDVSLVIPAGTKADVELVVTGADDDDTVIRSDFGYLTIDKKPGTQRATARLNGGGEKIVIRTTSGSIRLRKAPAS
jgi:DUF4097 and DUF4098 domain-containing protein YvlB